MRRIQVASLLVMAATLAVMAVNRFAAPLPDWAVRTVGVVMILALACAAYSTVKSSMEK